MTSPSNFDPSRAYIPQIWDGRPHHDDGREIELLHYIYSRPHIDEIRGHPSKVIETIDEFGRTKEYLMNVGAYKGKIISDLIAEVKPETMVEFGGYVGYSAILFADAVRRAGGKRYLSLEQNPEFAAVSTMLLDLAGLRDFVRVYVGPCDRSLQRLQHEGLLPRVDLLFIDHDKAAYTTDLKVAERLGLIAPGSVIAADNVFYPGAPEYLKYVRSDVEQKRASVSRRSSPRSGSQGVGNPNLIYESRLAESVEPAGERDGVEITKCVGIASEY